MSEVTVNEEGTRVKLNVSYGLKVNHGYNSENLMQSLSVDVPLPDGSDVAQAVAVAQAQGDALVNTVKMFVFSHLGIEGVADGDGVLQPQFPIADVAPVAQTSVVTPQAAPVAVPAAPVAATTYGPPKANVANNPKITADLDGTGVCVWIDLRPTKATGAYKPGSADFRDMANGKHQAWLFAQDGTANDIVVAGLTAVGASAHRYDAIPATAENTSPF